MTYKFFIKNNEREFKDLFFQTKKENKYIYVSDFNYRLIIEKNKLKKYYLFFALKPIRTKIYTDVLYSVSNKFGNYICKRQNLTWPNRYLIQIKDNYYLYYYKNNNEDNEICRVLYLNDVILRFDNDNLAWDTLTAKKIKGLMPFDAKKEIDKKLPLFIDTVNSLKLINEL